MISLADLRRKVFFQFDGKNDSNERMLDDRIIGGTIVLAAAAAVVGTCRGLPEQWKEIVFGIAVFSTALFAVEYVLRLWACVEDPRANGQSHLRWRVRHMMRPMSIVDLMAFLPALLPAVTSDSGIIAVARVMSLIKLCRHTEAEDRIVAAIGRCWHELRMIYGISIVVILIASSMLYLAERNAQPEKFGDIPQTVWWGIVTFATVGYGDVYPTTGLGKVIAGSMIAIAVLLLAAAGAVFTAAYLSQLKSCPAECPHCGKQLE